MYFYLNKGIVNPTYSFVETLWLMKLDRESQTAETLTQYRVIMSLLYEFSEEGHKENKEFINNLLQSLGVETKSKEPSKEEMRDLLIRHLGE